MPRPVQTKSRPERRFPLREGGIDVAMYAIAMEDANRLEGQRGSLELAGLYASVPGMSKSTWPPFRWCRLVRREALRPAAPKVRGRQPPPTREGYSHGLWPRQSAAARQEHAARATPRRKLSRRFGRPLLFQGRCSTRRQGSLFRDEAPRSPRQVRRR